MRLTRRVFLGSMGAVMASGLKLTPARAADLKVAIVMPGNITDKSWTQAGYEGLMRIKDELGIETAYSEKVGAARPGRGDGRLRAPRLQHRDRPWRRVPGRGQPRRRRFPRDDLHRQQRHRGGRQHRDARFRLPPVRLRARPHRRPHEQVGQDRLHRRAEDQVLDRPGRELHRRLPEGDQRRRRCSWPGPTTGTTSPRARKPP